MTWPVWFIIIWSTDMELLILNFLGNFQTMQEKKKQYWTFKIKAKFGWIKKILFQIDKNDIKENSLESDYYSYNICTRDIASFFMLLI